MGALVVRSIIGGAIGYATASVLINIGRRWDAYKTAKAASQPQRRTRKHAA